MKVCEGRSDRIGACADIGHWYRSGLVPVECLKKLQGREGYRLRIGDWRVIYELHDDELVMLVLELGARGGIY